MSWREINKMLTLAILETQFASELLTDPLRAVHEAGFELTLKELQVLREVKASDIPELSQILITQLRPLE